jgi:peptidoglycan/LPS O-acetylase OafA/YrhL
MKQLLNSAIALVITLAIAASSYQWLEAPFLRLKERFTVVPSRPCNILRVDILRAFSGLRDIEKVARTSQRFS